MANETVIKKILAISPVVEIFVRVIYYANIKYLKKLVPIYRTNPYLNLNKKKKNKKNNLKKKINFNKILDHLNKNFLKKGDLVILISSYKNLKRTGYSPQQIIDSILELIGNKGTLAMSARPNFKIDLENYITEKEDKKIYFYNVNKTKCNTGIIPQTMLKMKNSVRSRNPINSMVAIGPLAKKIMKKNLINNETLPHGKNSSWYKCVLQNAKILALGVDLVQASTITKTIEDVFSEDWPEKKWYSKKKYIVKDGKFKKNFILKERSPKWSLHYAERTMCKDFIKNGILSSFSIEGISIEFAESKKIFSYIKKKKDKSYPYFYTKYNLIKYIN